MRRNAPTRALASAGSLAIVAAALAACAPSEERAVTGPNGYTLAASFATGERLWWDRSPESGLTDLILDGADGGDIASCLGTGPLLCIAGPATAQGVLLIAPAGAERAVMQWNGQPVELQRGTGLPDDAMPVFGAVMPPLAEGATHSVQVLDASGAVLWGQ